MDGTSAAPTPRCPYCGETEHGTAACDTVVLVERGMDDIAAGLYVPLEVIKRRYPANTERH